MGVLLHVDVYGSLRSLAHNSGLYYGWLVYAIELNTSEPNLIVMKLKLLMLWVLVTYTWYHSSNQFLAMILHHMYQILNQTNLFSQVNDLDSIDE